MNNSFLSWSKMIDADKNRASDHPSYTPSSFSIVALRVLPECSDSLKKILSEEWYFFNQWYKLTAKGELKKNAEAEFTKIMFGKNISVQAIVGKNGSGKSSVMEIIYRMINNLSHCMTEDMSFAAADRIWFIRGIFAELYFESEGALGILKCKDLRMEFTWKNNSFNLNAHAPQKHYKKTNRTHLTVISRKFCYSLISNYALLSLDPHDYDNEILYGADREKGNWLNSIYNKNDGYTAAIGIEPYRGKGIIDLHRQKELGVARLYGLLIETNRNNTDFFDGYSYDSIKLVYDIDYLSQKFISKDSLSNYSRHPNREFANFYRKGQTLTAYIFKRFNIPSLNLQDSYVCMAAAYLVIKALQIAQIYPKYEKYRIFGDIGLYAKPWDKFLEENKSENEKYSLDKMLDDYIADLLEDDSHVTLKFRQTLHFLRAVQEKYKNEGYKWKCPEFKTYEDFVSCMYSSENLDLINSSLDNIMAYFPPPFFSSRDFFKEKIYK